jgi:hypothetical protein
MVTEYNKLTYIISRVKKCNSLLYEGDICCHQVRYLYGVFLLFLGQINTLASGWNWRISLAF